MGRSGEMPTMKDRISAGYVCSVCLIDLVNDLCATRLSAT